MTEEKNGAINITAKEFGRRFRKALSVPFLLNKVCSTNICEFVSAYSSALGCSEKALFFPLLSCVAACMGIDSHIELSNVWQEPPILWTLVITPRSLLRIDVAEHLKQELLKVQTELWVLKQQEDTKDHLKKFIFDMFTLEQLQEMLKLSSGHGFGIYNSIRSLHKCMMAPENADVMHRLHNGLSWFSDSRVARLTLTKTRMNVSVISTPSMVQQTLASAPSFQELLYQCFLTPCAEENHVKFNQLSVTPETEKLREIFLQLLKLHSSGPIVYKLTAEGAEMYGQIHDELTDKAKQMVRKNVEHKVFQPALSYLGRLSCVLHVLDNVIESINYKIPVSNLTWKTEISAATVWFARELLGHVIEQRHALMEQTTFIPSQKVARAPQITVMDGQESTLMQSPQQVVNGTPLPQTPQQNLNTPSPRLNSRVSPAQNVHRSPQIMANARQNLRIPNARRNIMNNMPNQPSNSQFDSLLPQNTPQIVSSPRNSGVNNRIMISSVSGATQPALLSRHPSLSLLDISDDEFFSTHKISIRKVLVHEFFPISPSRCIQLKLIVDPTGIDNVQKYSFSFARVFLRKLEKCGFGVCDGNSRQFVFKKKKFSALSDRYLRRLSELVINERDYSKCFAKKNLQNGSIVCLE